MNLLYTLTAYPPSMGGAQIHGHLLAQQMQARHPVQVVSQWDYYRNDWLLGVTLRAPEQARDYALDGVRVHRLGVPWKDKASMALDVLLYYPWMSRSLAHIAQRFEEYLAPYARQADLIHNVRIGREILTEASLRSARRRGIPFVLTPVHHPRWTGWRYQQYDRIYREADLMIALTQAEKQTLVGLGVREERIAVTGIGPVLADHPDPARFLREQKIDGPFVLFLGQHYLYKGYRQVLEAARQVWQHAPETHFAFIGPAVHDSDKIFASTTDRRIHRLGNVDLNVKTGALAACTVLCVPSTQESFGGVYTEAWSFAKPVIGCPIPAVSEVIAEGVDGFLVEQDPGPIAERIIYLLQHPAEAAAMGQAGQQKVEARYTWEKLATLTEAAYQGACQ